MRNRLFNGLPGTTRRQVAAAALPLLLALAAGGCSSGNPKPSATKTTSRSEVKTVSAATLVPGQPVPVPTGDQILRLSGRIGTTNTEGVLTLDLATLERLGLVSFELYEPFQKRRMGFQGVALGKLLDLAAADTAAQDLHLVALDDYAVDLKLATARTAGVMLATRASDGSLLPVEDGGPVRIVFLDGTPGAEKDGDWIWSLATVEVR
jgi:hypothetical protein